MRKLFAILMVCSIILLAINTGLAETSRTIDYLSFSYDDNFISFYEGNGIGRNIDFTLQDRMYCLDYVRIDFFDGGEHFPSLEEYKESMSSFDPNREISQGDWHGFKDVLIYESSSEKEINSQYRIPIYDNDQNVVDSLIINMSVGTTDDESTIRMREQQINLIFDSLDISYNFKVIKSISDTSNEHEVSALLGRDLMEVVDEYNLTESEFSDDENRQYEGGGLWIRSLNGKEVDCVAIIGSSDYTMYDVSYNMNIISALDTLEEYGYEVLYESPEDGDYSLMNESVEMNIHLKKNYDGTVERIDCY